MKNSILGNNEDTTDNKILYKLSMCIFFIIFYSISLMKASAHIDVIDIFTKDDLSKLKTCQTELIASGEFVAVAKLWVYKNYGYNAKYYSISEEEIEEYLPGFTSYNLEFAVKMDGKYEKISITVSQCAQIINIKKYNMDYN
ncbi:hypothetical protein ACQU0X_30315 [Pseudovibrio ascidiaceicola]|uniref:hypothetical protein n=1 Tax=Pseudovibrio ascidiaceicola TaxID=285279 RepID=UPI003D365A4A